MSQIQKEVQQLELVDGDGKVNAIMTKPSPLSEQCVPGRHCAHHGYNPFFCCLCGAEFNYATSSR